MNVLKTMRNMSLLKYLLWIVVISFIAAIFFVWGGGGGDGSGRSIFGTDYAVSVAGKVSGPGVLMMRYRQQTEQMKQMLGDQYRPEYLKGTAGRIANQMADELILVEMAEKFGLSVKDREVAETIQKNWEFENPQVEYPEMLSRMGLTSTDYEELVRTSLMIQKLRSLLVDSAYLSDAELMRLYTAQNEKYKAMAAVVRNQDYRAKAVPATEEELKARFEKEKATLTVPEKRTIKYVWITESEARAKVAVDESVLRAFYKDHIDQFSTNANQRQASHILIKTPKDAKPADVEANVEAARKKITGILERVQKGEDFAALAKQFSEDGSAAKGGDLGYFARDAMVKPFSDAVFDQCQTVGQVVGPVQSEFGFHIIKLTGIGGATKPFEQVRDQVKRAVLIMDPTLKDLPKGQLEQAKKELAQAKDLAAVEKVAASWGVKVTPVTVPFSAKDPIPGLGMDKELQKIVFEAKKDEWPPSMDFRNGVIRITVNSIAPAHPAAFEEVRSTLGDKILDERCSQLAQATAKGLATAASADDLKEKATAMGLTAQETGLLKRDDAIPGLGQDKTLSKALLSAPANTIVGPLQHKTGWLVAYITEHVAVDPAKFATEKEEFSKNQRQEQAMQVMDDFVAKRRKELEEKGAIKVNEELLTQVEPPTTNRG